MTSSIGTELRVAGLFAGIGGFEEGLRRSGHEPVFLCENDPAALAVLHGHFPNPRPKGDVRKISHLTGRPQLLTAGFPCQDLSQVGTGTGLAGSRSSLVRHVFRLLKEADSRKQPVEWVLIENVPFMLRLGRGAALEVIVRKLEQLKYRWAYRIVDTRAFGLPQRRERVFLLASRTHDPRTVLLADDRGPKYPDFNGSRPACGFYWTEGNRGLGWAVNSIPTLKGGSGLGIPSPPAIWMKDGRLVKPGITDAERLQGFERNWTAAAEGAPNTGRSARWRLVGNAVTVNVAEWIGARLLEPGTHDPGAAKRLTAGARWPSAAWNMDFRKTTRHESFETTWPVRRRSRDLDSFVKEPSDLSVRAAAGFHARFLDSSLRRVGDYRDGLIPALEAHLAES